MVKESIPKEGENIKIQSYKHDGNIHRVWSETTILKGTITSSLVERSYLSN